MINGTIRIPCDLRHFSVFEVDQDPATAMAHPAMTFDHGVIAVDRHFTIYIRVPELFNAVPPLAYRENKKSHRAGSVASKNRKAMGPFVTHGFSSVRKREPMGGLY